MNTIILNRIVTSWLQSGQVSKWFSNFLYDLYVHASTQEPLPGVHRFLLFWWRLRSMFIMLIFICKARKMLKLQEIVLLLYLTWVFEKNYRFLFYHCHLNNNISWIHKMFQQIRLKNICVCFRLSNPPYFLWS